MTPRVIVVGAGFGGIAVAVALLRAGYRDLTVLDSGAGVGGVWRDNTYPGCACDIPAPLYSFSFAPNPDWSRRYPPHEEILAYLERTVDRCGVRPHLRLDTEVLGADWDAARRTWSVRVAGGDSLTCDVLVSAVGQLSRPAVPRIEGLDTFTGPAFHSARWDHDVATAGRRIAVIGSGASAVQIVPELAEHAATVTVFQRTAPWTLPKPDRRYGRVRRAVVRALPATLKLGRAGTWAVTTTMGLAMTGNPLIARALALASRVQRRVQLPDRELRARATPDYAMGCKRVLFTSRWYRALRRDDVELVTERITRVTPTGVLTSDGREHPVDVIVLSTGFAATEFLAPMAVTGRDGVSLAEFWRDGAHAHLGLTVPGFPNLFLVYGPNTNTGNTSVVYFHEAQARYVVDAVRRLAARRGSTLEVRAEVEAAFDREMQERLAGSVWTGCESWYRAAGGRVVTNWPGMAGEYRRRTARLDPDDYLLTGPPSS